ncbi:hypothetical protein [Loktanella sp. Alg231-35]|uniref:hypothetical protein n=1 Tax=Loktanella sp. Alg231-35 TaxID=1922220 RepID=UPI001F2CFFC5|nr:hypothetical protein [Loktanella sp. Alg231-35]
MRLILVAAFVAVMAITLIWAMGTIQAVAQSAVGKDNTTMPVKFRRITYILLVLLMLGVASGLLGAA